MRTQWDALMEEFERDANRGHFERPADMDGDYSQLPEGLYREFSDFLISSVTAEFSGCVLYCRDQEARAATRTCASSSAT